jgi:hypothetical protein
MAEVAICGDPSGGGIDIELGAGRMAGRMVCAMVDGGGIGRRATITGSRMMEDSWHVSA